MRFDTMLQHLIVLQYQYVLHCYYSFFFIVLAHMVY